MKKELKIKNDCRGMWANEIIDAILKERGIKDVDEFLNPKLNDWLFPLNNLKNIDKCADIILTGINKKKSFGVYADVDLDGISSATIMQKYLQSLSITPKVYANIGKKHGTTVSNLEKIIKDNINILIIVDSLDSNIDNYKKLHDNGIEVIVIDHHEINPKIPYDEYITLVSSQRDYGNPYLCGAGTVWKVCMYIDSLLGTIEAKSLVDLAMAGTLSDMMNLSEDYMENRAIVNAGLNRVQNTTLLKMGGSYEWNAKTISFGIAPKVNSSMRIRKNDCANKAFFSDDIDEIKRNIKLLNICKEEQNKEVEKVLPSAIEQCEKQKDNKVLFVFIESKYDISGLLGNKLLEMFGGKPVIVLKDRPNKYVGSMRASEGLDFKTLCEDTGLCFVAGHLEAAGIEINYDKFENFRIAIEDKLSNVEFVSEIEVDAQIDVADVGNNLISKTKMIDRISGTGFPPLRFLIEIDDFTVEKLSNGKHLGIRSGNMLFIKWNFNDEKLYEELTDASLFGETLQCWGSLDGGYVYKVYNKMILDDFKIKN